MIEDPIRSAFEHIDEDASDEFRDVLRARLLAELVGRATDDHDESNAVDSGYLDALRTGSSTVDYIDTEPTPTEPPNNRHRWLGAAAAAATVAIIAGGLVLAARADDETGGGSDPAPVDTGVASGTAPVSEAPATTDLTLATSPAVDDPGTRVGFIGTPPPGATPSSSESGGLVVSIGSCLAPSEPSEIDELSEIDSLPPLGELRVLADGRLIWLKFEDLPEGANSLSTGLLEQRLTPEGVELMRSEASAAIRSGEPHNCGPGDYGISYAPAGGGFEENTISADNEHLARVMDPWSWLPATAWQDRQIRAYVPARYRVTFTGEEGESSLGIPLDSLTAHLPAAAVDLIDTKYWEPGNGGPYAVFTTDEARTLAAALDDAGLEQDALVNAFQLDYQFDYQDGPRVTPVHITFNVAGCETGPLPHPDADLGCES